MIRARLIILSFVALAALIAACESETGPDAPPRQNGCIDTDCTNGGTSTSSASSSGSSSGDADDAGDDAQ